MLALRDVSARYGAIRALEGVSLDVAPGEIVCLIGANGAGKSTALNVVSNVVAARGGEVTFEGERLLARSASATVRRGVIQVPEGRLVFPDLTVLENLEMGAYTQAQARFAPTLEAVFALFPRLAERRKQLAGLMSGGEQQMLAIGRALMAHPKLLLLDEPSMGLAPLVIADIFRALQRLRAELGCTILLVEQNARAALALADRGYVLANGRITKSGPAAELMRDSTIQEAFLGKRRAKASPDQMRSSERVML
ncbi:ABC transporter ATP-binding protein [Chelatococcus reniformis]|uniref:ABC transporter ATP-binding protein n=1 Tax=Chelatococcus reniformis TaxID=1494448 RepID=A0A916XKP9_9HYPH|nr:ABC transporter ATP-binding protein [Chelatococcus reniformis]GGC77876.1 ABC transporter ATP-binding protein [Chelatococcus reniformis]